MSTKIIYGIIVNGTEVLVEAANRHQAVGAATKPLVGAIRVLKGGDVAQAYRDKKMILIAGADPVEDQEDGEAEQQQAGLGGDGQHPGDDKN